MLQSKSSKKSPENSWGNHHKLSRTENIKSVLKEANFTYCIHGQISLFRQSHNIIPTKRIWIHSIPTYRIWIMFLKSIIVSYIKIIISLFNVQKFYTSTVKLGVRKFTSLLTYTVPREEEKRSRYMLWQSPTNSFIPSVWDCYPYICCSMKYKLLLIDRILSLCCTCCCTNISLLS